MLSTEEKKQAARKFREQKPDAGIYEVRFNNTEQIWVGASRNLNASRNSTYFSLRQRAHREKRLQEAWDAHGESAIVFEVLERFDKDTSELLLSDLLKERREHWISAKAASRLL